jgi:hypothetical protein
MNRLVRVEIPVDEAAAEALKDAGRRARIGRLVSQVARLDQAPILWRRCWSGRPMPPRPPD